jgi:hypothetical protein
MNLEILALISLALAAVPCGLFLFNLPAYRRLAQPRVRAATPVSVLIPARNEEQNIRATLEAVLANREVEMEVVVLDDNSTDGTAAIVSGLAARDPRLRLEKAPPLPPGWCGKQHACHVLAQRAKQPLLVFLDADVRLAPSALARMVAFMEENGAALASGVPRQELGTFSEKLLIPLIHFILLGFLPMRTMRRTRSPAFSAGCGQLFVACREAYQACGGHAQLRDSLHDGIKLPRVFRRAGFRTDLFDATDLATCRMYHTNAETWRGLGKNATEGLAAPATIVPMTALLGLGQVLPFVLAVVTVPGSLAFKFSIAACGLAWLPRVVAARRFRQSPAGALLHPLGVLWLLGIQWQSLGQKALGRPMRWKGRAYLPAKAGPPVAAARIVSLGLGSLLLFAPRLQAGSVISAEMVTNQVCASFELADQFGTNHNINFPRPEPVLLIVADRKGSEQIKGWVTAVKARYGQRLEMIGVADVGGAPGWVHGLIRKKFRKEYDYPILLDWSGRLPGLLHCERDLANVFLVAPSGRILAGVVGGYDAASLSSLTRAADRVVKPE